MLAGLGVTSGTRVAIQLPNLPQTVIAFYAVLRLGAVVVMTNPLYVEREIEHQWNDADCDVAITTDFLFAGRIAAIRSRLAVRHYVIASIPEYLRFPLNLLAPLKLKRAKPPLMATVTAGPGIHFMRSLIKRTPANAAPCETLARRDDGAALGGRRSEKGPSGKPRGRPSAGASLAELILEKSSDGRVYVEHVSSGS